MKKNPKYKQGAIFAVAISVELLFWLLTAVVIFIISTALPGLKWQNPQLFWLFLTGPAMLLLFLTAIWSKNRKLERFSDTNLLYYLVPNISSVNTTLKYLLIRLGLAFIIIALINPQLGSKMAEAKIKGIDIVICVDVSNSMKAEDLKPNRLVRATRSIEKLLERLHGDRIGIIVFAGQAFVQLPITNDYGAGKLFLSGIDSDIVPVQGTAIGSAIDLALESFDFDSPAQKTVVIITDGENHEDNAIESAKTAAEKGVKVFTIGMGSAEGTPIPEYRGKQRVGFKKDRSGNVVVSKLNETMLKEIAAAGNGSYIKASNAEVGLGSLLEELNTIEKTEMGSVAYSEYEDRFQIFLAIGLLLLCIEFLIRDRKGKLAKKLNIFE